MLKVLELFAGIGACSKALESLGIEHEIVDAVEIDKYAIKSFNAVHGTNFEPQDITKWDKDIEVDLIMHGSPCQDFSVAGKGAGGDKDSGTRSSLMYETLRIVEKLKPQYVIWENVKNLLSKKHRHNFDAYLEAMEGLGYHSKYQVLNAKDYGIPQNRERVFTISVLGENNFTFPEPMPLEKKLKDVLEDEVDEKYYLSDEQLAGLKVYNEKHAEKGNGFRFVPRDIESYASCISTRAGGRQTDNFIEEPMIIDPQGRRKKVNIPRDYAPTPRAQTHGNAPIVTPVLVKDCGRTVEKEIDVAPALLARNYKGFNNYGMAGGWDGKRVRKLTPKECWRLMGFDDEDFEKAAKVNSNTQLYKQAGNSIVVNVLEGILYELILRNTNEEGKPSV